MAKFPIERARDKLGFVPTTAVRANIDVRTGEEAIGQAVAGLGGALFDLGIKYDLKEANTQFSKYKSNIDSLDGLRNAEVLNAKDDEEIKAIYKKYAQQKKAAKLTITNRRANQAASIWDNTQIPINEKSLFDSRRLKTIDNEKTRIFEKQQEVFEDPSKLPEFEKELIRIQFLDKNKPDDIGPTFSNLEAAKILADTRKMAEVGAITNLYGAGKYEEARVAARAAKLLTPRERESLLNTIGAEERSLQVKARAELKAKQDETARNLLVSLWEGTLEDSALREATKSGLITFEKAKGLREALTNPKIFNLAAYIKVKNAVNSYERGAISFDDALGVLTSNASLLGNKGSSLTDKLFAIPNKHEADWDKEALNYIESQILEKDIFGRMFGTPKEQAAALEARLAYDVAIEEAERKKEPIEGRDKLIKAHEIMLKYRPEKEDKPPVELEKGLGTIPFVNNADIDKAIKQAKENLGEKATPQEIKAESLRLLK